MADILVFSTQLAATGGIENHLVRLCERLAPTGAKITLLCPNYGPSIGLNQRLLASCSRLIVMTSRTKQPSSLLKFCWLLFKLLLLQTSSFDSIYLNGQGSLPFWVWKLCGWRARRCVVHHHSSGEPDDVAAWPRSYRQLLQSANFLIACSKTNAKLLAKSLNRPVNVIYCFSNPCSQNAARPLSMQLSFGFIGRLIPEKGVDIILDLSLEPDLEDIHWHLWGSLEGYSSEFIGSYPNVSLHPIFDSHEGLDQAMAQLDAFTLFSTHREGLPLSLLEAMSAGVPWIASDRGGIKDLVVNTIDTVLLSQSFTYLDAFRATHQLALNLRQGLVNPGALVEVYRSRFDPDVLTAQWLDLLIIP